MTKRIRLIPPLMAPPFLLALLLPILSSAATAQLTESELDAATAALRFHGHSLFPNAIDTSDLRLRLLANSSFSVSKFTLFSPPDSLMFGLDLRSSAEEYELSLFRHVSPSRLSLLELRQAAYSPNKPYYIDSLLPGSPIVIEADVNGTASESLMVNRVRVSHPDIFLGPSIAVHGLAGILPAGVAEVTQDQWPVVRPEEFSPASSPSPNSSDVAVHHEEFAKYSRDHMLYEILVN